MPLRGRKEMMPDHIEITDRTPPSWDALAERLDKHNDNIALLLESLSAAEAKISGLLNRVGKLEKIIEP